jgi:hypothetical protein
MYRVADHPLQLAQALINYQTPGYDGEDGAQPWDVPEIDAACNEIITLINWHSQFDSRVNEEADETTRDEAARTCFGIGYAELEAASAAAMA